MDQHMEKIQSLVILGSYFAKIAIFEVYRKLF